MGNRCRGGLEQSEEFNVEIKTGENMSFAYKLWKIGRILTEKEIMDSICDKAEVEDGGGLRFINIDFQVLNNEIQNISYNKNAINREKLFFTKKIGGTSNSYYLYPNLNIQSGLPKEKIQLLVNTLINSVAQFADKKNCAVTNLILAKISNINDYIKKIYLEYLEQNLKELKEKEEVEGDEKEIKKTKARIKDTKKRITKAKKEYDKLKEIKNWDNMLLILCRKIVVMESGNYWIWLSINGNTFYELMPEVWDNWYKKPAVANDNKKIGYDVFTNKETEVGYKPEVKIFSYDQYHQSMQYRLNENLPLSLESARNIKFAWMYILNNLVFFYKGLEYIIIPNLISDDADLYKTVLNRFRRANKKSSSKKTILEQLNTHKKRLKKDIDELSMKKIKRENNEKSNELVKKREKILSEINKIDTGMIKEFDEQINEVGDIKNAITIDYIFTSIDRKNLSFEIKGSIEDVIPSQVQNVVTEMVNHNISDLVKLDRRDRNETLLQDFFNREELFFVRNRSQKNNGNKILQERLYLAKLLLTDTKIEIDQLLQRFKTNRLLGYDKKKRLTKDGISEWIEFSNNFTTNENNIYNFFKRLVKIKG